MMTADQAMTQAANLIQVPTDNPPRLTMLYCIVCILYSWYLASVASQADTKTQLALIAKNTTPNVSVKL